MKTKLEEIEKNKVLLKIEVPAEEAAKAINQAYKSVAGKVSIPGFRKGKIPKNVIDTRVGKEVVLEEAARELVEVSYPKAVESSDIEPIDYPEVEITQIGEGKPFKFLAKVDVKPKAKLGSYKGVTAEKEAPVVTVEEINNQLEILRERFAQLEVVEGKPIAKKDFALINFEGKVDGRAFEGGSANDYLLEVGSRTFIEGFEEQLIGARKGEIREVIVKFPINYPAKEIAGREARFKVLVKEIKQKSLPELNEEFVKGVGEFKTLKELKKEVEKRIGEVKESEADRNFKARVLKEVTDKVEVDIPDKLVDIEVEKMLSELDYELKGRGSNLENYLGMIKKSIDEVKETFKEEARMRAKSELTLEAVAREEKLKPTKEEIDEEIKALAARTSKEPAELRDVLQKSGNIKLVERELIFRKALNFLIESAKPVKIKGKAKKAKEEKTDEKKAEKGSEKK